MATKRTKRLGLLEKIDQHITNPLALDTRAKHLYPTGASCQGQDGELRGACARAVVYSYVGIPKTNPISADTMYTFGVGKHIELMLVEWFKEMGLFAGHNIKFYNPDFHLSGELDMVLRETPGSDKLYGVECKTSYGDYFKMAQITGRPGVPPAPKEDHVMQVMIYLDNFTNLEHFILVYIGRDKFDRIEYSIRLVEIDGDLYPEITHPDGHSIIDMNLSMARIYNRYTDTLNAIKAGQLPARDYRPLMTQEEMQADLEAGKVSKAKMKLFEKGEILTADWRCRYCDYKNLCRAMPAGKIDNFRERFTTGEFKPVKESQLQQKS